MSKGQWENIGGRRGPESGFIAPEEIRIVELEDPDHPSHAFYVERLSPENPDIIALAASMKEIGWETGSIAFLYRDGQKGPVTAAAARRRITAAKIENARRKREKDKRGPIEVPCMMTKDPATAEAIENAGRVNVPLMQTAREYVALREALGNASMAAARLVIPLSLANNLAKCLKLSPENQGKVNRHEIAVDVAARMADAGSKAAREVVAKSTDGSGKVNGKAAREAAREVTGTRAKSLPAHVIARVEKEIGADPIVVTPDVGVHGIVRAALALARGEYALALGIPGFRDALLRAGYDEERGRLPTGPNKRGEAKRKAAGS